MSDLLLPLIEPAAQSWSIVGAGAVHRSPTSGAVMRAGRDAGRWRSALTWTAVNGANKRRLEALLAEAADISTTVLVPDFRKLTPPTEAADASDYDNAVVNGEPVESTTPWVALNSAVIWAIDGWLRVEQGAAAVFGGVRQNVTITGTTARTMLRFGWRKDAASSVSYRVGTTAGASDLIGDTALPAGDSGVVTDFFLASGAAVWVEYFHDSGDALGASFEVTGVQVNRVATVAAPGASVADRVILVGTVGGSSGTYLSAGSLAEINGALYQARTGLLRTPTVANRRLFIQPDLRAAAATNDGVIITAPRVRCYLESQSYTREDIAPDDATLSAVFVEATP